MGVGPCGTKESSGRKAEVCMARHRPASSKANGECSPQGGDGIRKLTYCKQDEVLLVVLADTVIDPGTVVVHFPNAPLADAAVVGSVRLDAAALGTFVHHLPRLQL